MGPQTHRWEFRARFRRNAFGWKSQPAITRVRQAVQEITKIAKADPELAAEGAVLFLERVSPAIAHVDGSSGSMGTAVNQAVETLAPIVAGQAHEAAAHAARLERLWQAYQDDNVPYIESLGDHWGTLCGSPAVASEWADRLIDTCRMVWRPDESRHGYFGGTIVCLGALLVAGRHTELLELLEMAPYHWWHYRRYGAQALAAMGQTDEALEYAAVKCGINDPGGGKAATCEAILLEAGRSDEAYARFGLEAHRARTYLAWFRAVARTYPDKPLATVLADLVAYTPGEEAKWFAAAKSAKLFDEAIALANASPGSPKTLTRAARDFAESNPTFALEAGVAAIRWLVAGYGYEITTGDVRSAYEYTMAAAAAANQLDATRKRVRDLVTNETLSDRFVTKALGRDLGLT